MTTTEKLEQRLSFLIACERELCAMKKEVKGATTNTSKPHSDAVLDATSKLLLADIARLRLRINESKVLDEYATAAECSNAARYW